MKNLLKLSLLIYGITSFSLHAQKVDSLVNVLNTQKLTAEEKMILCNNICDIYKGSDIDKCIFYAQEGLKLANKEKDKLRASRFNVFLGLNYCTRMEYDKSLAYFNKALDLAIDDKNIMQEANVYLNLGTLFQSQEKYDIASEYYLKGLPLAEQIKNTKYQSIALVNLGAMHRTMLNNERALEYLEKAYTILGEDGDRYVTMGILYNLGGLYLETGIYEKSIESLSEALQISREINDISYESSLLFGLALAHSKGLQEYDKGEQYAIQCLKIAEDFGEKENIINAWEILSSIYYEQGKYLESKEIFLKVWDADSINIDRGRALTANLTRVNMFLGERDEAIYFFQKYDEFIRKFNEQSFMETLADTEIKYETEKKEIQIAALEKEKSFYIWIGIALVTILLLAFALLLIRHRLMDQKRKLAEQQIKQLEQEKQLVATQAVLDGETAERSRLARDLHDGLGGMLSVIKLNLGDVKGYHVLDEDHTNRFDKALEMLDKSIGELRRVAHHMMPESLMKYGLKVSLEDFCRAIPGANFQYLGENPRLDNRLEILIYRSAYELINNAVKYARATRINIQLMIDNGIVALSVQDNGMGFDPETTTSGTGLKNIRTRVSAYNGKMNIYSSPDKGTEVSIEIEPL